MFGRFVALASKLLRPEENLPPFPIHGDEFIQGVISASGPQALPHEIQILSDKVLVQHTESIFSCLGEREKLNKRTDFTTSLLWPDSVPLAESRRVVAKPSSRRIRALYSPRSFHDPAARHCE